MSEENQVTPTDSPTKPLWLQKLEEESWQAELALSGAAFFATLQLPTLFDWLEGFLLLNVEDYTLWLFDMVIPLLFVANLLLPGLFIFHLAVRALWIGLVGLNSVYPQGFTPSDRFSEDYQRKLNADYGNIDGYIQQLDRLGSSIFGIGFGMFLAFLNMCIVATLIFITASLLNDLPEQLRWTKYVVLGFGLLLFIIITSISFAHHPNVRDYPLVKKYHYSLTKYIGMIIMPISNRYINISTNLATMKDFSIKNFLVGMVFFTIGGLALGVLMAMSHKFEYVRPERYYRAAQDSTRIIAAAYAENEYEKVYVTPILPALTINNKALFTCWIPLPDRELEYLQDNCSLPSVDNSLQRKERRKAERRRTFECAYQYIKIEINGKTYTDFSLKQEYIANAAGRQYGVRLLIQQPDLQLGDNLLTVTTQYPHPDTGAPRTAHLPFYYTPMN